MLTIDLDSRLEASLMHSAAQAHISPAEFVKALIMQYLDSKKSDDLLVDLVKELPIVASFQAQDPLLLQQEMRNDWD
jgi:hypothetical protein